MEFNLKKNVEISMGEYDDAAAPEIMDNSDERWTLIEGMAQREKERQSAESFSERRFEDIVKMRLIAEG